MQFFGNLYGENTRLTRSYELILLITSVAKKNNLQVKEDKGKGIYVNDCTEVYVSSPEDMFDIMRAGS